MTTKYEIKERLLYFGIKPSLQRMAIMEYLMKNPIHPTVDIIFNELYPGIPTLSKTTVYNTLKTFQGNGAVSIISIDEKNMRYDGDISQHAHFKCIQCDSIYDLPIHNIETLKVANTEKLTIKECHLYYKGYCEKCAEEIK
jgi:Fur family ferric uptake transcriptional regulator/Fur family peroxide stress response transcriptional regulator